MYINKGIDAGPLSAYEPTEALGDLKTAQDNSASKWLRCDLNLLCQTQSLALMTLLAF